jgi:hypothetical protein
MNDIKKKSDGTNRLQRKYEQDSATDDGMPVAPEKSKRANPAVHERPRTAKQQVADAKKRWGMVYPPHR